MKLLRGKATQRIIIRWARILAVLSVFLFSNLSSSFQNVEAKPLSLPDAAVSLGIPSSVMIGDDFSFTVTFENNGTTPGYGPFIDLVFPLTGQDGNDGINYDVVLGSTYLGVALEDDVQTFPDDGFGTGCVSHPWLRDTSGNYVDVCGNAGDQFVSIRLPFGSFVPGQPRLDVTVNAHLSNLADLTPDLVIYARGGYMFGATPEDDWCCGDAPFAVPNSTDSTDWPGSPVTPQLMTFDKSYTGPGNTEDETATGPNFPRQYTLTVTIADGQTLTDIDIQDLLPDNVQFIGIDTGNTSAGYTVNSLPSTTEPGGTLSLRYASWTGTIVVTYDFYIPELFDLPNPPDDDTEYDDPVIDPATGNDVNSDNIAWVDASWFPLDARDNPTPITSDASCPTCTPLHTLVDKSIAIQKSVSVVAGTGGGPANDQAAPGAILEYTLQVQVSDFFTLDDIFVTDTISDGQHVLPSSTFVPTLEVIGNPGNYGSVGFNAANYEILCDYTGATTTGTECTAITTPPPAHSGETTLTFNISDEIGGNGRLVGGCVNPAGGMFSSCDYNPTGDSGAGPTTATIVFRTQILDKFIDDYPSGDISVDQGDELDNSVDVGGDVLDNTTYNSVDSETDNATAGAVIGRYSLAKTIYAINDDLNSAAWDRDSLGRIRIKPGDKITYRLTYDLLTSDVEELTFDDYFPLPVFDVTDPDDVGGAGPAWSFTSAVAIPAPGVVALGPADTFYSYMSAGLAGTSGVLSPSTNNTVPTQDPVITADGPDNKINIYYADYDDTRNQSTTVDLLFSLIVSDDPFADGLFLTNMAHAFEGSTNAGTSSSDAIFQFVLAEPVLVSTKGIIWKSNTNPLAVFDPVQTGPAGINFLDPSNAPRWTGAPGIINSSGLASNPIDSNVIGIDAGDTLTFAIVIENQGSSINGAFDIKLRDILDTDYYQIPAGGLNLQIYYGDGTGPIPYRDVGGSCTVNPGADNDICGEEIFNAGLELIDPVGVGVCSAHDPNSGNNVILITYDLELKDDVVPGQAVNTSTVFNFAGTEGGSNHLEEVDDLEDDATADVVAGLEKTLDETEFNITTHPTGINLTDEVVVGELVQYTLSAVLPEGIIPGAKVVDQLDGGLAFVSCDSLTVTADIEVTTDLIPADFSGVCGVTEATGVSNAGQDIIFDLGTITNVDRDDNLERISITYTVVVTNVTGNQNTLPTVLNNQADFLMDSGSGDESLATASADVVEVIEPQVVTEKFTPAGSTNPSITGDAGDPVSYTINLINPSTPADTIAYDLDFSDNFPLCPIAADGSAILDLVIDSQSGGATFVLSGNNASGWVLSATYAGAPGTPIDFVPGDSATVNVSGTIAYCVTPGLSMDNTGTTTWTSLSGDYTSSSRSTFNPDAVERTGADGVDGLLNDYASEGIASVLIDTPVNAKYLIDTSELHTRIVGGEENVAVGEIVRYRVVSAIPEGTSPNFQIRDLLGQGLVFLNDNKTVVAFVSNNGITSLDVGIVPSIPDGPNPPNPDCNQTGFTADANIPVLDPVNCSLTDNNIGSTNSTSANVDVYSPGIDPRFKLGTLVNNDSDGDTEYVVIEFNALVSNINGDPQQNDLGENRNNSARIQINGVDNGSDSNYVVVNIAEPVISVAKSLIAPLPQDAGDPIEYEIVFTNTDPLTSRNGATAFELVLNDTFDNYLENVTISSVSTTQGATCAGDGAAAIPFTHSESLPAQPLGGILTVTLSCLDKGQSITLRITGDVVSTIPASTEILNTAFGTGTSLPGPSGTIVNPTGSDTPGVSGSDTGERDGSDTDTGDRNDYYDEGELNHSIQAPVIDKYVEAPAAWTIGETFTYDLVVTLPEGVTPDMVVYDDIPVGLDVISHNIITVANPADPDNRLIQNFAGTLPSPVITGGAGSGDDLSFVFPGNTITTADNNTNNNSFQVQITVRLLNIIGNQNGDILTNQGELRYSSGTTATGTVDITVIEPVLSVDKTVDDDTPSLDQTITYTIEIAHDLDGAGEDSRYDAFNVHVTDTLPTGVSDLTNIVYSSTGNCATGFNTSASTSSMLDVTINEIPYSPPSPGCVVTISFDATVDSAPDPDTPVVGDLIDNTAEITWTSIQVRNGHERSGDDVVGNVDDYETNDTQQITVTNPELRISKDDGTLFYVPGESVTYTIIVENVGNAAVSGAIVTDSIPAEVLNWDWVCSGSTPPAVGCDGVLNSTADFDDTINLDAGQSLTYQVTANTDPATLSDMENIAVVDMPVGIIEPTPLDNTDNDIDSATPEADLRITKDDYLTIISPGVTLTYTVLVENTSPSNVIGAEVEDLIPAEISSWSWVCAAEYAGASGCDPMASSAVDFNDIVNLPAHSSIEYTVTAQVSSAASGTLTNTATVTSPVGVTERNLTDNTDDDVDGIASHEKNLISLVHGATTLDDVAIGEILIYEVTLTVPPGSMTHTHLVDTLDRGLAFVSCESITPGSITTSAAGGFASVCTAPTVTTYPVGSPNAEDDGRQVDFDFDTLTNPGAAPIDLVIRYRVVVLDSLANQSDSTPLLVNDAEWVWDSGVLSDQADGVNILEPDMTLSKDAYPTILYPGQLTTFTLVVEHTPGSQTSAYDVELEDILPADLIFQSAAHVSGQAPTAIITAGDPTIIIQWDEFLNTGVNSVIDIVVMLDPDYQQRKDIQYIINEASLSWTSLPGDFSAPQSTYNTLSTERFYDPLSNINIYGLGDDARIRIPALPDTGFAPGKVTDLPLQRESQEYGDLNGLRVDISKLGISVPIVSVPISDNGWDLNWLWNQAGWLEGTAYPSWYGNTVITGHAYLPSGYPGPFADLGKLSWGDEITLYAHGLKYTYQVRFVDLVAANDYSILQHKDQDWLTLFTCKDYSDEIGGYLWRQAVQAVLVDVENME